MDPDANRMMLTCENKFHEQINSSENSNFLRLIYDRRLEFDFKTEKAIKTRSSCRLEFQSALLSSTPPLLPTYLASFQGRLLRSAKLDFCDFDLNSPNPLLRSPRKTRIIINRLDSEPDRPQNITSRDLHRQIGLFDNRPRKCQSWLISVKMTSFSQSFSSKGFFFLFLFFPLTLSSNSN